MGKPSKPRSQHDPQLRLVQLGESIQPVQHHDESDLAEPISFADWLRLPQAAAQARLNDSATKLANIINEFEAARRAKRTADRRRQRAAQKARMQQESES